MEEIKALYAQYMPDVRTEVSIASQKEPADRPTAAAEFRKPPIPA